MTQLDAKAPSVLGGWQGRHYDEIVVDESFPPVERVVTAAELARYRACLGRTGSKTETEAGTEPATRVPAFLLNEISSLKRHMRLPPGVLHAQEELTVHGLPQVDEPLVTTVRVIDKYRKNDKRFVVIGQETCRVADLSPVLSVRRVLFWPC